MFDLPVDKTVKYSIFRPEEHGSEEHAKIRKDYIKWMKRKLKFQPHVQEKVMDTFESIARKLDYRPSQITYIGMHNRRSKEFNEFFKKQNNKKPLKKGYFYDAMEDMRVLQNQRNEIFKGEFYN